MTRSPKISPPSSARLFSEPRSAAPPSGVHLANIDGASRGNPGPAAYAFVVRDAAGKVLFECAKRIGAQTNNVAEYYALLAALDYAVSHGIAVLRVRSDSELLVRQMQGRYKVKSADLKPLHERASKLARQLAYFAIEHVPREMNRDADALANQALDGNLTSGPPAPSAENRNTMAETRNARLETRRVRARFVKGVLVPSEPLSLPEGAEVLLDLRFSPKE